MSAFSAHDDPPALSFTEALRALGGWVRREPLQAVLMAACLGVLVYFFGFYPAFTDIGKSAAVWTWEAWNPENDLEHGWLILPIALYVVWHHRGELAAAPKRGSRLGLVLTIAGVLTFVAAVWTKQPRVAIFSLPLLGYGITRYLWGPETARKVAFPCAFLLFMVPIGFLVSRTVGLQTLTANVAATLGSMVGVAVKADGARLFAVDGSFDFEVAGGCSGIRSLTAMTMLAALYVHFTQRALWKKAVIFASSLLFALAGNLVRIFTVVLVAKAINPTLAAGLYHDYSGFIFFPIAVGAMVSFANLLNRDWGQWAMAEVAPPVPVSKGASAPRKGTTGAAAKQEETGKPASPISYDY